MSMLTINYDRKYDTLYVGIPSEEPKYGTGGENGIVTFLGIDTDRVLGFMIEDFKARLTDNTIPEQEIPIAIDFNNPEIKSLVFGNGKDYKTVIYQ